MALPDTQSFGGDHASIFQWDPPVPFPSHVVQARRQRLSSAAPSAAPFAHPSSWGVLPEPAELDKAHERGRHGER